MTNTCECCGALRAEMESARVEVNAVQHDRAARVRSGEFTPTNRIALSQRSRQRWFDAVSDLDAHRASKHHAVGVLPPAGRKKPLEPTLTSPDGLLSPRQKQIVMLIAQDLIAEEIGKRLEIGPRTVEFHLDLIKQKLNVADDAGIVRYAIRTGLIEP